MFLAETELVAPGLGLMLWVLISMAYLVTVFICAVMAILKGRWPLALIGLVTFGIVAIVGGLLDAKPGSYWSRRFPRETTQA
jgi:uncharacterized membrane protein YedE/YeeE